MTKEKPLSRKSRLKVSGLKNSKRKARPQKQEEWILCLYVAGQTAKSITALSNLKKICEEHLKNKYRIEVIDLLQKPQLARGDQILAVPTLVRRLPPPMKKIIGDLSNMDKVLVGLDLRPLDSEPSEWRSAS